MQKAITPNTKAIFIAHTLGNPFDLDAIRQICKKYNLYLIEDNCDALGSKYDGKFTGTFGDCGTLSFYPAHHITTGEGGAVLLNDKNLIKIAKSLRDWGRDCYCASGVDDTCKKRFSQQFYKLPFGYDHKYVYSHFGYNLKATEMQASIGLAQLDKLEFLTKRRKENFARLFNGLKDLEKFFILPKWLEKSDPSWFGFALTLRDNAPFTRNEITEFLEKHKIQTRNLFAGNILNHPLFSNLKEGIDYKSFDLSNTNKVQNNTFWLGVYAGLDELMIDFIIEKIREFCIKS